MYNSHNNYLQQHCSSHLKIIRQLLREQKLEVVVVDLPDPFPWLEARCITVEIEHSGDPPMSRPKVGQG